MPTIIHFASREQVLGLLKTFHPWEEKWPMADGTTFVIEKHSPLWLWVLLLSVKR